MFSWASNHLSGFTILAMALGLAAFILSLNAVIIASQVKKKTRRRTSTASTEGETVELLKQDYQELQQQIIVLQNDLMDTRDALRRKIESPRMVRFNAFGDVGSDLSFSMALVDENQTGVIVSSIYGREESRTYAKPVYDGNSTYPLTDEERMALRGESNLEAAVVKKRRPASVR